MSRIIRLVIAALLLSAGSANAQIMFNFTYFVGSDVRCDFTDIQSAINFAHSGDYIYVAAAASAYPGHLNITKSLELYGTDACGDDTPPPSSAPFATISGAGGGDAPAVAIGGGVDVFISGLEITGGHAGSNGFGGGIDYSGVGGTLVLSNVVIDNNSSQEGGGLAITPVGSTVPDIYLNDDVQIFFNTATDSGAGIYVEGGAEVYVMGRGDFIAFNTAGVSGGGIFIATPAHIALGSPGLNGLLVYGNNAQYGGGIAGYDKGGSYEEQFISVFTTDSTSPGQITGNRASAAGGGVYVQSSSGDGSSAAFCAMDFRIDFNSASQGAALYLENGKPVIGPPNGSKAYLNTVQCRSASSFHAVSCAAGTPCNEISGNTAVDSGGNPTDGAVVLLAGGYTGSGAEVASVEATRLTMHGNQANYLFQSSDEDGAEFALSECLTGGNTIGSEMIRMEGTRSLLNLQQCTLAPDIINSTHVIKFDNADDATTLTLLNSIIDEPGTLTLNYLGPLNSNSNLNTGNIISNDVTTLPGNVRTQVGTPLFVDGDNPDVSKRDYHLLAYLQNGQVTASPGIDFVEAGSGDGSDLDGNPYDQDVPLVPNFAGPRDLGAYEAQPIVDRIFGDAFGDPLSLVVTIK